MSRIVKREISNNKKWKEDFSKLREEEVKGEEGMSKRIEGKERKKGI